MSHFVEQLTGTCTRLEDSWQSWLLLWEVCYAEVEEILLFYVHRLTERFDLTHADLPIQAHNAEQSQGLSADEPQFVHGEKAAFP